MLCSINIIVIHKKESLKGSDSHRTITKTNKQLENIYCISGNLGKNGIVCVTVGN